MLTKLSLKVFNTPFKFSPQIICLIYTYIFVWIHNCFEHKLSKIPASCKRNLQWKKLGFVRGRLHLFKQNVLRLLQPFFE